MSKMNTLFKNINKLLQEQIIDIEDVENIEEKEMIEKEMMLEKENYKNISFSKQQNELINKPQTKLINNNDEYYIISFKISKSSITHNIFKELINMGADEFNILQG